MFGAKKPTKLETAINRALSELESQDVGSKEYTMIVNDVVKLHKMKEDEKPDSVSMDTAATIAANILGILLIIRHENVNVISSQAMSKLMKLR
jgi:hypothetical protein